MIDDANKPKSYERFSYRPGINIPAKDLMKMFDEHDYKEKKEKTNLLFYK